MGRGLTRGTTHRLSGPRTTRRGGGPQLVTKPNFLGGEGSIVESQLVNQPDEGATVHAARRPRHRLEAPQEDAARLGGQRRRGRDRLRRDAIDVELEWPAAALGDDVVPAVGDVVPRREKIIPARIPGRPPVEDAEQARGEE